MNRTSSAIEKVVMRRIYRIRLLRALFSTISIAFLALLIALWGIGNEVWVVRVLQNAPADFYRVPDFFISAFAHTRTVVQVLSSVLFLAGLVLVRELARRITLLFTPVRAY